MASTSSPFAELPRKRIVSRKHLAQFVSSATHADIVSFIQDLNESVVGVGLTAEVDCSENVKKVLQIVDQVAKLVEETPPVDNGKSRFGNPAFRTFYDKVVAHAAEWHSVLLPSSSDEGTSTSSASLAQKEKEQSRLQLATYFCESWGNRERVDYGSGMELNFVCWLLCLKKLGLLKPEDGKATVLKIFWKYMMVTRSLQSTYWLEPAGSHGAQGLDDYHFCVFIFGSAQLRGHKYFRPKSIHDAEVMDEFSKDYMYFEYIRYINSIKTASLRWHSPMLDDISGVKTWDKVNSGMIKMYIAEVLGKLPVVQHFLFSEPLLPFPTTDGDVAEGEGEDEQEGVKGESGVHVDEHGHLHVRGEGFGDCCGIPIPSAFAAAQEEKEKLLGMGGRKVALGAPVPTMLGTGVRRIPFD